MRLLLQILCLTNFGEGKGKAWNYSLEREQGQYHTKCGTGAESALRLVHGLDFQDACSDAAGLLASGIIPVVRHCLDSLLTTGALVIPASATVFAQVHACLAWLANTHKAPAVAMRPVVM